LTIEAHLDIFCLFQRQDLGIHTGVISKEKMHDEVAKFEQSLDEIRQRAFEEELNRIERLVAERIDHVRFDSQSEVGPSDPPRPLQTSVVSAEVMSRSSEVEDLPTDDRRVSERIQRRAEETRLRMQLAEQSAPVTEPVPQTQAVVATTEAVAEAAPALVESPEASNPKTITEPTSVEAIPTTDIPAISDVSDERKTQREAQRQDVAPHLQKRRRPLVLAGVIVGVILLVVAVTNIPSTLTPSNARTIAAMSPVGFADNDLDGLLAAGLTTEIADQLKSSSSAQVWQQASMFGFTWADMPAMKMLPQRATYTFSIAAKRSSGGLIVVDVHLMDSLQQRLWTRSYERSDASLATLPRDVAQSITEFLGLDQKNSGAAAQPRVQELEWGDSYASYVTGLGFMVQSTRERANQALRLFETATARNAGFGRALTASALVRLRLYEGGWNTAGSTAMVDTALIRAEEAAETNPDDMSTQCALAWSLVYQRRYEHALDILRRVAIQFPRDPTAYTVMARVNIGLGRFDAAAQNLDRALSLDPSRFDVIRALAVVQQLRGLSSEALPIHETILRQTSDSTAYLVGPLASAVMFDPELSLTNADRIIAAFQRALQRSPSDPEILYRFGRFKQVIGDATEALDVLLRAEGLIRDSLKAHPSDGERAMLLALIQTRRGRYSDAMSSAQRALALGPSSASVRYGVARIYSMQMYSRKDGGVDAGKRDEAVRMLREAFALQPNLADLVDADLYNLYQHASMEAIFQNAQR
jgi:tetratricopeptide (TPR) repeat protein